MTVIQTHPKPDCPDCGAKMRLIRPGQGKTKTAFWGCSQYVYGDPDSCQGKRQINSDGTPEDDTGAFGPGDFDDD